MIGTPTAINLDGSVVTWSGAGEITQKNLTDMAKDTVDAVAKIKEYSGNMGLDTNYVDFTAASLDNAQRLAVYDYVNKALYDKTGRPLTLIERYKLKNDISLAQMDQLNNSFANRLVKNIQSARDNMRQLEQKKMDAARKQTENLSDSILDK